MGKIEVLTTAIQTLIQDHPEFLQEGTTGNDLINALDAMREEEFSKEYPNQDDTWPSRKWNKDHTDYIDLSGHDTVNKFWTR